MSKARQLAQKPSQPTGRKNLIINGAMTVAQRGTSFTSAGYTLDRWYFSTSGATGTVTQESMSASDRATYGFEKYAKVDITTGNNNSGFYYRMEGRDLYQNINKKFTLSFLAKGTNPAGGSFEITPRWYDGTNLDAGTAQTISVTSNWAKYEVTFEFPDITNADSTHANFQGQFFILQPNGDTGSAAWELNITGVQLEVGSTATEFEHRSYGEELALCQRYYEAGPIILRSVDAYDNFPLKVVKRASPSVAVSAGSGNWVGLTHQIYTTASSSIITQTVYTADSEL